MAAIKPEDCSVFIQIWVDFNEVTKGSGTKGVYLVDNRRSSGSEPEAAATLTTSCALNSAVCWEVLPIDPAMTGTELEIRELGSSKAFGSNGQPEPVDGSSNQIYTGKVERPGDFTYKLGLNLNHQSNLFEPALNVED